MAPGITNNVFVSALLLTTAASIAAKAASAYFASRPFYNVFLIFLPLVAVLQLSYHLFIYPRFFCPLRHFPMPTTDDHWLMGHERSVLFGVPRGAKPLEWMKSVKSESGLIRFKGFFNTHRLLVTNPKALADVLNHNCYDFEKPPLLRGFLERVIGVGLILVEQDMHKTQRKNMLPSFTIGQIRELYPVFWDKMNIMITGVKQQMRDQSISQTGKPVSENQWSEVEMAEWSARVTLDIIGVAAMGREFNCMRAGPNDIVNAYLEILEPTKEKLAFFAVNSVFPAWFTRILPIPTIQKVNQVLETNVGALKKVCREIVSEQKLLQGKKKEIHPNILSSMIQKGNFNDEGLVNQMLTFLAAGHETTASALTWMCYLLSQNPEAQKILRKEIRDRIPTRHHQITYADLENLPYLNGVCNETLRLFPTVPATIRVSIRDTTVNGHHVPKDTLLLLVPYAVNRNPEMWYDADTFMPERWIDLPKQPHMPVSEKVAYFNNNPEAYAEGRSNNNGGAESNYARITFLHGPRACIASGFAHAELRTLAAAFVGTFEWQMRDPDKEVVPAGVVTTKPRDGMWLKMREVHGWE